MPKRVFLDKIFVEYLPKFKNNFRVMTIINDVRTDEILFKNKEKDLMKNYKGDSIVIPFIGKMKTNLCGDILF